MNKKGRKRERERRKRERDREERAKRESPTTRNSYTHPVCG